MPIREPSTAEQLLTWHVQALSGRDPARHDADPQCGWYKVQLVKEGPWTPVMIWCDQDIDPETGELTGDEVLRADVFGEDKDPHDLWTWLTPITEAEYDRLTGWRLGNQHKITSKTAIDLAAQPTLPRG